MNFFKRVIHFFSVLWNAITWRKNEKKGKPASRSEEEEPEIAGNDPNSSVETEKSFVDVPLNSSGQAVSVGIPAVLTSCKNDPDLEKNRLLSHSPCRKNVGLEDNASSSLSFFSEPIRDDPKLQVPIIASFKNDSDEIGEELVAIPNVDPAEDNVKPVGETKDISDEKGFSSDDLLPMHSDDPSCCVDSFSNSSTRFVALDNCSTEDEPQCAVMKGSLSGDHTTPNTTNSSNNLDYSAIDIHLFDHDSIIESDKFDELQTIGMDKDNHSIISSITTSKSSDAESRIVERNACTASSSLTLPSTIPSHHLSEEEWTIESCSTYSTNYMVKSDSLVNFLLESGCDPIVDDVGLHNKVLVKSTNARTTHKEEPDCTAPLLKEGRMEELMCTKKGILQLSGDYHIEGMERPSDISEESDLNDVDSSLLEAPPLKGHCATDQRNLNEPSRGDILLDNSETFYDIQRSNEAAHEDCETEKKTDGIPDTEKLDGTTMVIEEGRTNVDPIDHVLPDRNKWRKDSNDVNPHDHDVVEEDQCSRPNILSQSRSFQLGEGASQVGDTMKTDILAVVTPTTGYGGPSETRLSSFGSPEIHVNNPFASATTNDLANSTQRFIISSNDSSEFFECGSFSESDTISGMQVQDNECVEFIKKQRSPISGIHGKIFNEVLIEGSPCSQAVEDLNEFYPFIDCSSYLFRIPEEIRKETSFNPCVGSAPSRPSPNSLNPYSARLGDDTDVFAKKYPNMSSLIPDYLGNVANFGPCLGEEYMHTDGLNKMQSVSEYSHEQLSEGLGTFWGAHPGIVHGDQQINSDYHVASAENYEGEYVNVVSAAAMENDHSVRPNEANSYGYVSEYDSAVQFPVIGIPYGGAQHPMILPREPLVPIIFPLHPVTLTQCEGPSIVSLDATEENEPPYPNLQTFWDGYSPHNVQLQITAEHEKDTSSFGIARELGATVLDLSSEAIDDDDDDSNGRPDPYCNMNENTSLNTVSKADSFTGSLFCESLRSIVSRNTDNDNIYPSLSYSSVQGCGPSLVMQSCRANWSNDSLPQVTADDAHYSKIGDDDYLATEKFMNDVNTALNQSVLDQIQSQTEPLGNLLGRGDGSISMNPDLGDDCESMENGGLSRNSLGENISINNSKLTLLDGVMGMDSITRLINHSQVPTCGDDSADITNDYCREIVGFVLERVISQVGQSSTSELASEAKSQQIQGDGSLVQRDNEHFIVQNVVIIDDGPNQIWRLCRDDLTEALRHGDEYENEGSDDEIAQVMIPSVEHVDKVAEDNIVKMLTDDKSLNRKRRGNKRRKKSLDVGTKVDQELCNDRLTGVEETGMPAIGDGTTARTLEKRLHHGSNSKKVEDIPTSIAKLRKYEKNTVSKPIAGGERYLKALEEHDSNGERVDAAKLEEQGEQLDNDGNPDQDEAGESSSNPSHNRRRRNRRKKRKN